jgi:ABC-type glycerol-3-phosphate transport system permease component
MKMDVRVVRYSILIIWVMFCITPMFWVFSTAFKPNEETKKFPPALLPEEPTFENFEFILSDQILFRSLLNSLLVSFSAAVLCIIISSMAGYAFSRYQFKGKTLLMGLILGSFLIPAEVNIIPIYIEFYKLFGTTDSHIELVIVYLSAAIVIMSVPPIIILILFQRHIITGLKMGGVKG